METLSSPIFLQIINALNIGVMVFDQQQQLKVWNHWLEKHAELPASLVCGKHFAQLFPDLRGSRVESAINGALRQGHPAFLSQSLNKSPFDLYSKSASNGSVSRIQQCINVVPISGDNGERYAMLQVSDVTAAVQREMALRRQCETALRFYLTEIHALGAELSISTLLAPITRTTPWQRIIVADAGCRFFSPIQRSIWPPAW